MDSNATHDNGVNFDTQQLVIVAYSAYAGGKFLINCLALSDHAYMQNQQRVQEQQQGLLSPRDKLQYLKHNITAQDFRTGCVDLFDIGDDYYRTQRHCCRYWPFSSVIAELSQGSKRFFLVAHRIDLLEHYLEVWPRAQLLAMTNAHDMVRARGRRYLADPSWDQQIEPWVQQQQGMTFDTNTLFSESNTVNTVRKLYEFLHLPDFDADLIQQFYHLWTQNRQRH